jgi:hypothetical protein
VLIQATHSQRFLTASTSFFQQRQTRLAILPLVLSTSHRRLVAAGATAVVTPYVLVGTYGPYTANSDIGGLDYSTDEYSGFDLEPENYRGFELRNVGEELDKYSDRSVKFKETLRLLL